MTSSFSCALGSSLADCIRPSLENAFVFISFSQALNFSICCVHKYECQIVGRVTEWEGAYEDDMEQQTPTVSISLRFSRRADLSLMSLLATQALIWSRNRWSFFICVFKSVSSFSFCVWFVEACIFSYMLSKTSTPSPTFFSVRSISAMKDMIKIEQMKLQRSRRKTYFAAFWPPLRIKHK